MLGRPNPEHAEVGEHHQVEESQLEEVWEAAMVLIKWGVLLMTSRLFVGTALVNGHTSLVTIYLPRKVGTDIRRKTKRQPLLVYKLVFATTLAANRVHFVLRVVEITLYYIV